MVFVSYKLETECRQKKHNFGRFLTLHPGLNQIPAVRRVTLVIKDGPIASTPVVRNDYKVYCQIGQGLPYTT